MNQNAVLKAVRNQMIYQEALHRKIAQELGEEKARELEFLTHVEMGIARGKQLREESGNVSLDAVAVAHLIEKHFGEELGMHLEIIEESPERVVISTGRCPVFEAMKLSGAHHRQIEAWCGLCSVAYMDNLIKQLNPGLNFQLQKYRQTEEDSCQLAITLATERVFYV